MSTLKHHCDEADVRSTRTRLELIASKRAGRRSSPWRRAMRFRPSLLCESSPRRAAASLIEAFRHIGVYAGRILKGTKPRELPVQESVRFELVVNLQAAKALGIAVPSPLLARADEVIE